jgi:TonB family protein
MADPTLRDINPNWLRKPSGEDMAHAYPERAQREERSGHAVISCKTNVGGYLTDCRVESESPAGYGFGAAALSMADEFKIAPGMREGVLHEGHVRIPIAFRMPEDDPAQQYEEIRLDLRLPEFSMPTFTTSGAIALGALLLVVLLFAATRPDRRS